jgi:hypothetical protein
MSAPSTGHAILWEKANESVVAADLGTHAFHKRTHVEDLRGVDSPVTIAASPSVAQQASSTGVRTLSPHGAIKPTGTWNLATRG